MDVNFREDLNLLCLDQCQVPSASAWAEPALVGGALRSPSSL